MNPEFDAFTNVLLAIVIAFFAVVFIGRVDNKN